MVANFWLQNNIDGLIFHHKMLLFESSGWVTYQLSLKSQLYLQQSPEWEAPHPTNSW